ncbi:hypothetical protein KEJ19_04090 [Candidatus Bathyarchaeota archaeon]|nr:hypothetical protein [Candidatus Bathyarchaeota archaeon]
MAEGLEELLSTIEKVVSGDMEKSALENLRASRRDIPDQIFEEAFMAIDGLLDSIPRRRLGIFIVIAGLDKSGKETQAFNPYGLPGVKSIRSYLEERSFKVLSISLPSYRTILGALVGAYLEDRGHRSSIERPSVKIVGNLSSEYAWILWSLDRARQNLKVREWLQKGKRFLVLSKRWTESHLAYQRALGIEESRILKFERNIVQPDFTFILDIPAEEVIKRAKNASIHPDRYENMDFLNKVREGYLDLYKRQFPGKIILIDGTRSPEEVNKEIIEALKSLGL